MGEGETEPLPNCVPPPPPTTPTEVLGRVGPGLCSGEQLPPSPALPSAPCVSIFTVEAIWLLHPELGWREEWNPPALQAQKGFSKT